jgi:hypothetical protein
MLVIHKDLQSFWMQKLGDELCGLSLCRFVYDLVRFISKVLSLIWMDILSHLVGLFARICGRLKTCILMEVDFWQIKINIKIEIDCLLEEVFTHCYNFICLILEIVLLKKFEIFFIGWFLSNHEVISVIKISYPFFQNALNCFLYFIVHEIYLSFFVLFLILMH